MGVVLKCEKAKTNFCNPEKYFLLICLKIALLF